MKKILTISLLFTILTVTILHMGCKKSTETNTYTLTVNIPAGVLGSPETGRYTHDLNDKVDYDYTPDTGYLNLEVRLDGSVIEPSGTITIEGDHSLQAYITPDPEAILFLVSVTDGIDGAPAAGIYYRYPGATIDYSYSLKDKYQDLVVKLDNVEIPASGTITIDAEHVLTASATLHYDIRSSWTLEEKYNDGSSFNVTVTFSGDSESGTVSDSDGGVGTYTVNGTVVKFNLAFPDVAYDYSGLFATEDTISGSSIRIFTDGTSSTGAFIGTRITTVAAAKPSSKNNNKGNR